MICVGMTTYMVLRYLLPGILSFAIAAIFFEAGAMRYQDYVELAKYWQENPCPPPSFCRVDTTRFALQDAELYVAIGTVFGSAGLALILLNSRHKPAAIAANNNNTTAT
jgi:hypothetical protein